MAVAAGPRFLLEASFLVVLAVVLGFADLSVVLIIVVMGLAWVLVSLIEYFAWRQGPRFPPRFATVSASALMHQEERESSERAAGLPPPAPPPEEQTAAAPPREAPPPTGDTGAEEPEEEPQFEVEQGARYSLEPLRPRPRRRWILFGPRERQREEPGSRDEES